MALELVPLPSPPEAALLAARGAIDLAHAPVLDAALGELARRGVANVAIDCGDVRYVSSSGFGVLVKHAQALEGGGGGLALLGVPPRVAIVIEMLGIESSFSVVCRERPPAR